MSKIYGVFDVKADAFLHIMVLNTNGQATRGFADVVNDPNSQVSRHPEDYKLMVLADFDESSGRISPKDPESLGFGVEYVARKDG